MTVPLQEARNSLLERAAAYVRSRLHGAQANTAETLVRAYWERVGADDLVGRDPVDLAGAALAHLHLAERRRPGTARVRVYTPTFDDHGWASTHSVVEVVVDDMPFLLDSVSMELVRHGCGLHLVVHPVIQVARDDDGHLIDIGTGPGVRGCPPERASRSSTSRSTGSRPGSGWSGCRPISSPSSATCGRRWRTGRTCGPGPSNWPPSSRSAPRRRTTARSEDGGCPPWSAVPRRGTSSTSWPTPTSSSSVSGTTTSSATTRAATPSRPVPGSGLGILRDDPDGGPATSRSFARVPVELRRQSPPAVPLILTKAGARATVHRPTPLDYVGVKRYDADGTLVGERRFFGLYTSTLHKTPTADIPVLRRTVAEVIERAGFAPASHDAKALAEVIEALPRLRS